MADLSEKQLTDLRELLKDAEACARLTQWETEFVDDLRGRVLVYAADTRISDAQWTVIRRIEGKIYA
jgi:hypothetical protein